MARVDEFKEASERYAAPFDKGDLPMPRPVAVVTYIDARLHPEKFLGLAVGDAHVFRNTDGRVSAWLPHHPGQTSDGPHRAGEIQERRMAAAPLGADRRERREDRGSRRVRRPRLLRLSVPERPQGNARFLANANR